MHKGCDIDILEAGCHEQLDKFRFPGSQHDCRFILKTIAWSDLDDPYIGWQGAHRVILIDNHDDFAHLNDLFRAR